MLSILQILLLLFLQLCAVLGGRLDELRPCQTAWKYFNNTNSCYFTGHWETFSQAEETCTRNEAHLVSVHSKKENQFINGLYTPELANSSDLNDMTWLGLHRKPTKNIKKKYRNGFMKGVYDVFRVLDANSFTIFLPHWPVPPADWQWTDGSSRNFQNWKEQPPETGADCVVQRSSPDWNLQWEFVDCDLRVHKYVCKKPAKWRIFKAE